MNTLGIIIIIAALLFCLWVAILVIRNLYYMNALPKWIHSLIYKVGNFRSWRTTMTQTQSPYTRPRTRVFARTRMKFFVWLSDTCQFYLTITGKRGTTKQEHIEEFWIWLSSHLPDHLVYWCTMHLFAHATSGRYKHQEVPALTVIEALQRWEDGKL